MVQTKVSKNQLQTIEVTIGLLKELSSEERVILALHFYEELNVEEIAEVLEQPVGKIEETLNAIQKRVLQLLSVDNLPDARQNPIAAQAF